MAISGLSIGHALLLKVDGSYAFSVFYNCLADKAGMPAKCSEKNNGRITRTTRVGRIVRASWESALLAIVCARVCFGRLTDRGFINAICTETRRIASYQGAFSSLRRRMVIQRLFFDSSTGSVGPL
jgi:hypothetical protein